MTFKMNASSIQEVERKMERNEPSANKHDDNGAHLTDEQERINHQRWCCGDSFHYPLSKSMDNAREDPWKDCHETAADFDADMVQRQRSEVDNLLIFAGLFSAVLTAFTIESYKWPQGSSGNGLPSSVPQPYVGPAWAIQVNALWFISLTLSISVSLLSILCMQWLREFQAYPSLSHKRAFELRQLRFEGLLGWNVLTILRVLPFLLQLALVFFFIGLLMLLAQLHANVVIGVAIIVGLTLSFLIITSVMPTIQFLRNRGGNLRVKQCPYKSFQSWMILWMVTDFQRFLLNPGMFLHIVGSWCLRLSGPREQEELGGVCNCSTPKEEADSKEKASSEDTHSLRQSHDLAEQGSSIKPMRRRSFVPEFMLTFGKWATTRFRREEDEDVLNISGSWDWIQYDMYWRKERNSIPKSSRDSISFRSSSQNSSSTTDIDLHHDVINGLQWMHQCRAFGSEGTLLVHPCVRNLELEVAARVLRGISGTKDGDDDCLNWVVNRYCNETIKACTPHFWTAFRKFNKDIVELDKQLQTSAIYQEMVSLLALRMLSREPIFKGPILQHYLELYTRLKNTIGDDAKSFFTKPLRVIPDSDPKALPLDAMSHDDFVTEIFLSNPYLPADSFIQMLVYWKNHAKLARENAHGKHRWNAIMRTEDSEMISEEPPSKADFSESLASDDIRILQLAWNQMQPAWNILSQWLKRSMSNNLPDDKRLLHAVCDLLAELEAYTRIFWQNKKYKPLQDCADGLVLVVGTIVDKNRQSLFEAPKSVLSIIIPFAKAMHRYMKALDVDDADCRDSDWPKQDVRGFIQFLEFVLETFEY